MKTLRTPEERFENLAEFNFEPHYAQIDDGDGGKLRVHYLDEGPADANPVLLMHGEPSWCYLYRRMIPVLVAAGHRVIAPDLVGFGRSDKPAERSDYTYSRHVAWMSELLLDQLGLRHITFFGQDWGGLIGLRLVASSPERFDRVVISNTGLPTGDGRLSDAFLAWQNYSRTSTSFPIGNIVNGAVVTKLSPQTIAAYDAPFPDDSYKEGARIFPSLVPTSTQDQAHLDNTLAWGVLKKFERPFLCAFGDSDPVTKGGDSIFIRNVPGAAGQPHTTITDGGHFIQEDKAFELANIINTFIATTTNL
ncbi:MAG: haloalkane dehalogenase [Ilumatobacteraceae bacterium]